MTPRACQRALKIGLTALLAVAAAPGLARGQASADDPPVPGDAAPETDDAGPGEPGESDGPDSFFEDEDDLFSVEEEITPDAPPPPVAAPDADDGRDNWSLSFGGGYAVPVGAFSDSRSAGLATSIDGSWTGAWGVGLRTAVQYAPIPHDPVETDEEATTRDGHVFTVGAQSLYALRLGDLRVWGAAGGAVVMERLKFVTATQAMSDEADDAFEIGLAAAGAVGVDYLVFGDGGPSISTEAVRSLVGNTYGYLVLRAGLAFVF